MGATDSPAILQSILSNMGDGVVVADENGKFLIFNPAAERIIGIGATETLPEQWSRQYGLYLPDTVTPFPTEQLPLVRAIRGEEVQEVELFVRHAASPEGIWISASARPLRDDQGTRKGGIAVFRDVTEHKRTERRLAAQHATTGVLAESWTLNEATPRILQAICESLGWEMGAIWSVNESDNLLRCVATWHQPGVDVTRFETRTRETTFPPGVGLPGRVWESKQPAWIADVTKDPNFPRASVAADSDLHGAFGFPILLRDELLGVIEFFSREIRRPDDNLLKMMASIGSQIGQFIDRKRAEQELIHERHLLRALMDNVPDAIYFKDAESRFIRINKALALKNSLFDPTQAIGKTDFDFFSTEHAQQAFDDEHEVMRTGHPLVGKEEKETWPDGHVTWVLTTKLPLRDKDGVIAGTLGISRDITNRKKAEQALRDSEALYHSLVESLPLNVFRKDLAGRLTFANTMYAQTLGRPLDQLIGKTDFDLFPKELAEKYRHDDHNVTETGSILETVEEHQMPAGERLFVQVIKCPVRDSKGEIVGTQVIFWDVTAKKRAEEAMKNSERRYRQFTEGSQDGIVVANQHGTITLFNAAAQKTFGYKEEEASGQPITILMPIEFVESHTAGFARYLATRQPHVVGQTVELRGRRKNGEEFYMDLSLTALDLPEGISFLAAIRDTTDRHRMQDRLVQSEKMASLGELSAYVAHEINNPLAFVANNLAVLDRDLRGLKSLLAAYDESRPAIASVAPDRDRKISEISEAIDLPYVNQNMERILDSTRQGVKRVADIVQTLRGFVRLDQAAFDRVNIHDGILLSQQMIQARLERRNITVEHHFGKLPLVFCSPAQLNQVFLNLLVNAMQAIEATRNSTGRIQITTKTADGNIIVEIADDGCGIPPEVVPKIFTPFFTTKKTGEGTGLGLSITHGIVEDHNGEIEVESKLGEGTQFRVILPIDMKDKTP